MTIQRAHISLNQCDRPLVKGSFGCEWMILNEAKCAFFENYLL
ncbi:penicillin-binding protein [Chryseobacterium shandongense]|uniref:Penicillin-binding protein n=1 Tax=Chryseobacterium shandongense TaxID=1493872 RepID=A0A3G6QGA4_9FLAO|nr:penicillin-binding protein [Chryseobacterium shandongense]AZA88259.1 penicillin-binding protein [Chryseobacterium shandongense]AZA96821.1 penicillin-binding protein [Chryseobacterium shandongense]